MPSDGKFQNCVDHSNRKSDSVRLGTKKRFTNPFFRVSFHAVDKGLTYALTVNACFLPSRTGVIYNHNKKPNSSRKRYFCAFNNSTIGVLSSLLDVNYIHTQAYCILLLPYLLIIWKRAFTKNARVFFQQELHDS